MLRYKVQHAQYFGPDFGISQLFTIQFSNGFQHHDEALMLFPLICELKLSDEYFYLPSLQWKSQENRKIFHRG